MLFDLVAGEVGVAVVVEEAGLGGEERAFAVDTDGAAFEDHVVSPEWDVEVAGDFIGDGVVFVPGVVLSTPGVESEGVASQSAAVVDDEDWAVVSYP